MDILMRRDSILTRYSRKFQRMTSIDWDTLGYYWRHVAVLYSFKRYCPSCRGKNIRRSWRKGFFEFCILPFFLLRPFRCERCASRFYGLIFATRDEEKLPGQTPQADLTKP